MTAADRVMRLRSDIDARLLRVSVFATLPMPFREARESFAEILVMSPPG